ncbi:hypothetical protein SLA2020_418190 [Shorea laevis]
MDASKLNQLKQFVEHCKSDPSILTDPSLSFFREYIESLGAQLPPSAYEHGDSKSESFVVEESDEDMDGGKGNADDETVEHDIDPPQKMGDPSVEVTDESRDAAQAAKAKAIEAISEGNLEEAIENLTEAILLNPTSAIMYGTRATVYIKMKKPNAAIRDANAALEINPDSAKGYKARGMAQAMLGHWEKAAKDLHLASTLDYDEEIKAVLKKVEPNAHRIEEHRRKYERLHKEREERKMSVKDNVAVRKLRLHMRRPRSKSHLPVRNLEACRAVFQVGCLEASREVCLEASQEVCLEHAWGAPGNVDFGKILKDPELMAAFSDPEVMAALQDVMKNPANLAKHQGNPKVAPVIAKMMSEFAGPK